MPSRPKQDVDDLRFSIDVDAYYEAQADVLHWLRTDCGNIGRTVARLSAQSDYGASEIVDALVVNMLDRDAITVEVRAQTDHSPHLRTRAALGHRH